MFRKKIIFPKYYGFEDNIVDVSRLMNLMAYIRSEMYNGNYTVLLMTKSCNYILLQNTLSNASFL